MQLSTNKLFNTRILFDDAIERKLKSSNTVWDWFCRIISYIYSPSSYSDENRRTVRCFKNYLVDVLGAERLSRISSRYGINLDVMAQKGSPLLSRDVAKIVIGSQDVRVEEINRHIGRNPQLFPGKSHFQDLTQQELKGVVDQLGSALNAWKVQKITSRICGKPSEKIAEYFFDPFLADRERLLLCKGHPNDSFELFLHNTVVRVIKRELDIGMLIPAPNHSVSQAPQFYYVSGKVISGEGMVSYLFHPATADTQLEPLRLFRGTATRNCEIDAISTLITDLESDLGRSAYESGLKYDPLLQQKGMVPSTEVGHSLGSALIQYRLANLNHIQKAYLFNGPGIPAVEAAKFNRKNQPVKLTIRQSAKDKWSVVGQVHLGRSSPPNVEIDYRKYHAPRKIGISSHVAVWGREKGIHYGIEGGHAPHVLEADFYNHNRIKEKIRSFFGPILALFLRAVRLIHRSFVSTRAEKQKGLQIGRIENGLWKVEHFR